jgi:peptidoglycan/LPS O-acetylase OafA/YrhL
MLMAELLFIKRTPLSTFYWRRASRILPAFLVFVLVVYIAEQVEGNARPWDDFLATALFLRSYFPVHSDIWSSGIPIGHIWSLNVEEHAYLLMSLLTLPAALLSRRRAALALIAFGLLSYTLQVVYLRWWSPENWRLHTEVLVANILLSAGYRLVRRDSVPGWLPLIALVGAVACYVRGAPWWAETMLSPILLAFTVNHLGQIPQAARRVLEAPLLRWKGIWSFSIYLWQQPFFELTKTHISAVEGLTLALVTGLASYYGLERPARAWLNSLGGMRTVSVFSGDASTPSLSQR